MATINFCVEIAGGAAGLSAGTAGLEGTLLVISAEYPIDALATHGT
jgi:hypothetical protein